MLIKDRSKLFLFTKNINFLYSKKLACFFIFNSLGIYMLYLPSYYFYILLNKNIIFLFLKFFFYQSFLKHLFVISNKLTIFYFFKIRIKGLGFRIRSISDILYYFFFNYTNFFYFYPPESLLIRVYKKRMLLISFD